MSGESLQPLISTHIGLHMLAFYRFLCVALAIIQGQTKYTRWTKILYYLLRCYKSCTRSQYPTVLGIRVNITSRLMISPSTIFTLTLSLINKVLECASYFGQFAPLATKKRKSTYSEFIWLLH